jgi:predicted Zn-dependent peptidase
LSRLSGFKVDDFTLDNGLRVFVAPQPQLHRVHVAVHVRTGSRYETAETNGLSHFLEHMIYRGNARLPSAHAVNDAFERLGGYLYAATQTDFGVFSLTLPPESLDEACMLFGEALRGPAFLDIDLEKAIVCDEILEDRDDDGREVDADNLSRGLIYPTHPLGYTITGDEAHVNSFSEAMLRAHHEKHYIGEGSALTFTGAIDRKTAERLAHRDFDALRKGTRVPAVAPVHQQKAPRFLLVPNQSSQTELRVCFRADSERAATRPATDLLMRIIDDGMSTRLYHRLCDDQGLCYDVSAGYDGYEDDGIIDFAAGVQHKRVDKVTREILGLVTDLATAGPTDEEIAKAKRRHAWDLDAMLDSPEDLGAFFGAGALFDSVETPEERLDKLARVTADEVRAAAQKLADPARLNVVAVGLLDPREHKRVEDTVMGFAGATGDHA